MAKFKKPKYILYGDILHFIQSQGLEKFIEELNGEPCSTPRGLMEITETSLIPENKPIMFITKEQYDILRKVDKGMCIIIPKEN